MMRGVAVALLLLFCTAPAFSQAGPHANVEVTDASASLYEEVEDHFTNRMELDDIYVKAGAEPATTK